MFSEGASDKSSSNRRVSRGALSELAIYLKKFSDSKRCHVSCCSLGGTKGSLACITQKEGRRRCRRFQVRYPRFTNETRVNVVPQVVLPKSLSWLTGILTPKLARCASTKPTWTWMILSSITSKGWRNESLPRTRQKEPKI